MGIQWGKKWDQSIPYSKGWCCPECDWKVNKREDFGKHAVGIDSNGPVSFQDEAVAVGILVCPRDGTNFYFHISEKLIEFWKNNFPEKFSELHLQKKSGEIRK